MADNSWVASVVLMLLGLITEIAGILLKTFQVTARPYPGFAEAEVVDIIPVKKDRYAQSEFRNRQAAVFEFYSDGKLIKIVDSEDLYPCPYTLHQHVKLSFDPDDPVNRFCVIQKERNEYFSIAIRIAGMFLILMGVLLFLKYALRYLF